MQRQCYLTVQVYNTDYDEDDEYVVSTTANGERCTAGAARLDGAVTVGDFFECVKMVELPVSPDGTYTFVTTATPAVNENPYEGSFVHVEYMVDCEGTASRLVHCRPPPPPPAHRRRHCRRTCEYSATPAGGGRQHQRHQLPSLTRTRLCRCRRRQRRSTAVLRRAPPLAPAPPGGYSPPPPHAAAVSVASVASPPPSPRYPPATVASPPPSAALSAGSAAAPARARASRWLLAAAAAGAALAALAPPSPPPLAPLAMRHCYLTVQ